MSRKLQVITADGTYKIADIVKRFNANDYECTLIAQANASFTLTGNTNTSTLIDNLSSVSGLFVGQTVTGTDIPAGTTIAEIFSYYPVTALASTTPDVRKAAINLSQAATGTTAGVTITVAAGTFGSGTVAWKVSYDGGKTLLDITNDSGTALTQTANGSYKAYFDTGVNINSTTSIYAVVTGSTNPVLTIGISDNN